MWGREHEAGKLNFASVAATGAPTGKLMEEQPVHVDASKAPGYRASMASCSPGGAGHSPRAEPPPSMMPMLDPQAVYAASRNYEPPCYSETAFQPSPPPPAVALSRLNPRAPDFALGGKQACGFTRQPQPPPQQQQQQQQQRWAFCNPDMVYPPTVGELLAAGCFDNGLAGEPLQLPGHDERKVPRPIGTERHWKLNGYEQQPEQNWIDGKQWQNFQRPNYRMSEEMGLLDGYQVQPLFMSFLNQSQR